MSVSFPDGRQPRDSIAEIGFSPQPPASARPGEIFEQVGFWFYPYANRHSLNTPRVDLDTLLIQVNCFSFTSNGSSLKPQVPTIRLCVHTQTSIINAMWIVIWRANRLLDLRLFGL
jgi:hypothetical protein